MCIGQWHWCRFSIAVPSTGEDGHTAAPVELSLQAGLGLLKAEDVSSWRLSGSGAVLSLRQAAHSQRIFTELPRGPQLDRWSSVRWVLLPVAVVWRNSTDRDAAKHAAVRSGRPCTRRFGKALGLARTSFSFSRLLACQLLKGKGSQFEYHGRKGSAAYGAGCLLLHPWS